MQALTANKNASWPSDSECQRLSAAAHLLQSQHLKVNRKFRWDSMKTLQYKQPSVLAWHSSQYSRPMISIQKKKFIMKQYILHQAIGKTWAKSAKIAKFESLCNQHHFYYNYEQYNYELFIGINQWCKMENIKPHPDTKAFLSLKSHYSNEANPATYLKSMNKLIYITWCCLTTIDQWDDVKFQGKKQTETGYLLTILRQICVRTSRRHLACSTWHLPLFHTRGP